MRARSRRILFAIAGVIVALLALPYVVAPLYRFGQPISTPMLWRWATGQRVERVYLPLGRMASSLPLTVILSEDGSFCRNRGVDFGALREALEEADDDLAEARGGSTITQQIAKNLFLWPGRSYVRKILEFPLALWLNLVLPKQRVMEIYLNVAEWGPDGQFGAEAAALWAFGRSAHDLTPYESGELAAVLPNPFRRSARTPSPLVRRLAGLYQRRAAAYPGHGACIRSHAP